MKKSKILLPLIIFFTITLFSTLILSTKKTFIPKNIIRVHFIDVGQGDSILIQVNNKNLLIDSGPKSSYKSLFNYLNSLNLKRLDYIIATHPHEDHIGNMSSVIDKYQIGGFYAPKVTHTSKSFETMIESLLDKDLKINVLKAGNNKIDLGENTKISVLSPTQDNYGSNLNLYSPIIKLDFINTSFIFTGDAEVINEKEVLNSGINLRADVLKLAHHGSSTSTSKTFYEAINPSIAVISVGNDNSYNHPNKEILSLLTSKNTIIYRTDTHGNILLESNGVTVRKISPSK